MFERAISALAISSSVTTVPHSLNLLRGYFRRGSVEKTKEFHTGAEEFTTAALARSDDPRRKETTFEGVKNIFES
jgi:hypothetical protein